MSSSGLRAWAEADETVRIREEELQSRRTRDKQKRARGALEGLEKKKLKVSNISIFLFNY